MMPKAPLKKGKGKKLKIPKKIAGMPTWVVVGAGAAVVAFIIYKRSQDGGATTCPPGQIDDGTGNCAPDPAVGDTYYVTKNILRRRHRKHPARHRRHHHHRPPRRRNPKLGGGGPRTLVR